MNNILVIINFMGPLLVMFLYLKPLVQDLVVPDVIDVQSYKMLRLFICFMVFIVRAMTFRLEC